MKALVGAFNQEKALVGAFSVIVQPIVEPMGRFTALVLDVGERDGDRGVAAAGAGRGEQPRVVSVGGAQPDRGHLGPDPLDLGGLLGAQLGRDGDVEHDEEGEGDDEGHDGGVDTEPSGEVVIRRRAEGAVGTCKSVLWQLCNLLPHSGKPVSEALDCI